MYTDLLRDATGRDARRQWLRRDLEWECEEDSWAKRVPRGREGRHGRQGRHGRVKSPLRAAVDVS